MNNIVANTRHSALKIFRGHNFERNPILSQTDLSLPGGKPPHRKNKNLLESNSSRDAQGHLLPLTLNSLTCNMAPPRRLGGNRNYRGSGENIDSNLRYASHVRRIL